MELQKAISLFLGEHKPSTQQAYSSALYSMQNWIGPTRDLSGIRPEMLIEYFQMLNGRNYSPATIQKHVKTVKTFFNWGISFDLLERSPARAIKGKKLPTRISREKAMTDEELNAILSVLRYKPRDYALIMFLADTGCRRGGAVGLRLQDIDFGKRIAVVTEKGDKTRNVAFGDKCASAIEKWIYYRSTNCKKLRGTYIFTRDGQPMKAENISLIVRRAAKIAGIRVLSSHSLRHRKGHQLADARIAPSIAATALGHSDPMITLTYYYPHDWESAERALRELTISDTPEITPSKIVSFK